MLLKDKVCIVVGAGSLRGIGHATAELFAEHGAKVVVVDRAFDVRTVESIKSSVFSRNQLNVEVTEVKCDITDPTDCDQLIRSVLERHGSIDCLVNSAGIVKSQSMLDISQADFDLMVDVNLKGTFNLCQRALKVFVKQQSGVIVNVASAAAQRGGGLVGGAHYAASKGGVISLTRTIAREFGSHGVRANVICPAMIETSMLDGLSVERTAAIADSIPLKRNGTTRECAGACLFLASELSGFVTGATIDVNGGSHIH